MIFVGQAVPHVSIATYLSVTGVTGVIVHLGLNDITIPSITAGSTVIPVRRRSRERQRDHRRVAPAHAARAGARGEDFRPPHQLPSDRAPLPGVVTPENEAKRQAINRWIRTGGAFDGIIDFDAAVRDPANPARLLPAYDFDGIHLTDAGYQAMAERDQSADLF